MPCNNNGILYGKVTDKFGMPIKNALVKIMSDNCDPIDHTKTDLCGNYVIYNIPYNKSYKVFVTAKNYALSKGTCFFIKKNSLIKIDIVLKHCSCTDFGIVLGEVIDKTTSLPIKNAVAILYKFSNNVEVLKSISYSNEFGQFAFTKLPIGNYTLKIYAIGYYHKYYKLKISCYNQFITVKTSLCPDISSFSGTVSGVITDKFNSTINDADVILYKVTANNSLIPIDFTRTNEEGVYLFMDVSLGAYKIKATKTDWISIKMTIDGVNNE